MEHEHAERSEIAAAFARAVRNVRPLAPSVDRANAKAYEALGAPVDQVVLTPPRASLLVQAIAGWFVYCKGPPRNIALLSAQIHARIRHNLQAPERAARIAAMRAELGI